MSSPRGPRRILIADDDEASLRILERALRGAGHDVAACRDGTAALERLLAADGPRLAVLDWSMPGLDGVAVCREVRRRSSAPYVYLVLLTGRTAKADMLEGLAAGADDFLSKPPDDEVVRARLWAGERVLRLHERLLATRGAAASLAKGGGSQRACGLRILIADDDAVTRRILERGLGSEGHAVLAAPSGDRAWELLEREHVSVLVSDCMMPGLTGLELTRRLREEAQHPYVYVVLMTALGQREDYLLGMEVGADDFLTKPVDMDEMHMRLRVAAHVLRLQAEIHRA